MKWHVIQRAAEQRNGVELLHGAGSFWARTSQVANGLDARRTGRGQNVLIATGTRPAVNARKCRMNGQDHRDSDQILDRTQIPKRFDCGGGGVIGWAYACMFATLGSAP